MARREREEAVAGRQEVVATLVFMCGRFTSTSSVEALVDAFHVDVVRTEQLPLRYNVAPTQDIYVVATRRSESSQRVLGAMRWGLVPSWSKDLSSSAKMINARAEGIGDRRAFAQALLKRRCIIPVDDFYEWQATSAKAKLPWAIRRRDRAPMALAGLWEVWRNPAGEDDDKWLRSCTIVTSRANEALSGLHHRMPVVLDADQTDRWLDPSAVDRDELQAMLVPAPSDWFEAYPVSTLVNKVALDGPELLEPLPVRAPHVLDHSSSEDQLPLESRSGVNLSSG